MSKTIEKKLVIKTSIKRDEQFKQEIDKMKKELGGNIGFDQAELTGLKNTFNDIAKSFSEEIQKAVNQLSKNATRSSRQRSAGSSEIANQISRFNQTSFDESDKRVAADLAKKEKEEKKAIEKAAKINQSSLLKKEKEEQKIRDQLARANQVAMDEEDKRLASSLSKKERDEKKVSEELKKFNRESWKEHYSNLDKDLQDKARKEDKVRNLKFKEEMNNLKIQKNLIGEVSDIKSKKTFRSMDEFNAEMMKQDFKSKGIPLLPENTSKMGTLGKAFFAGGIGAATAAILSTPGSVIQGRREARIAEANLEQRSGLAFGQGNTLESSLVTKGKSDVGFFEKMFGGLKASAGTIGAGAAGGAAFGGIPGAIVGGLGGLGASVVSGTFKKGMVGAEQLGVEEFLARNQIAGQAFNRAQSIMPTRVEAMRGGSVNSRELTDLQFRGAGQGFGVEQTLQQLLESKAFLGKQAATALPELQKIMNQTGMGVGEQAQAIESISGFGGNTIGASVSKSVDILKKGVAAGLDVSKSGQFLKTTASVLEQQAGFGKLDVDKISNILAGFAQGFAGNKVTTEADLRQAQQLFNLQRNESVSEQGLSGINNIMSIQESFQKRGKKLNTQTLLALSALPTGAKAEDIQQALSESGLDETTKTEISDEIMRNKAEGTEGGAKKVGLKGLMSSIFAQRDRGLKTISDQFGIERAKKLASGMNVEGAAAQVDLTKGMPVGPEMEQKRQEAMIGAEQASSGIQIMGIQANDTADKLKAFSSELTNAIKTLQEMTGMKTSTATSNASSGSPFNMQSLFNPIEASSSNMSRRKN